LFDHLTPSFATTHICAIAAGSMNPAKMAKEDHDVGVFRIYARNHLDEAPTNVDSMSSGAASDVGGVVDLIADR
jgi:hypothetical protein